MLSEIQGWARPAPAMKMVLVYWRKEAWYIEHGAGGLAVLHAQAILSTRSSVT